MINFGGYFAKTLLLCLSNTSSGKCWDTDLSKPKELRIEIRFHCLGQTHWKVLTLQALSLLTTEKCNYREVNISYKYAGILFSLVYPGANSIFSSQTKQILIENPLKRFIYFFLISADAKSDLMGTGIVLNGRSLLSLEVCKGPIGWGGIPQSNTETLYWDSPRQRWSPNM